MDDMMNSAKLDKLRELRKLLREIAAEDGPDEALSEDVLEDALEESSEESMSTPAEMEGPESEEEEDELTAMKRKYFQPKAEKKDAKGVAISILAPVKPPKAMDMPKMKKKG